MCTHIFVVIWFCVGETKRKSERKSFYISDTTKTSTRIRYIFLLLLLFSVTLCVFVFVLCAEEQKEKDREKNREKSETDKFVVVVAVDYAMVWVVYVNTQAHGKRKSVRKKMGQREKRDVTKEKTQNNLRRFLPCVCASFSFGSGEMLKMLCSRKTQGLGEREGKVHVNSEWATKKYVEISKLQTTTRKQHSCFGKTNANIEMLESTAPKAMREKFCELKQNAKKDFLTHGKAMKTHCTTTEK